MFLGHGGNGNRYCSLDALDCQRRDFAFFVDAAAVAAVDAVRRREF